jgi:hypothetical protein
MRNLKVTIEATVDLDWNPDGDTSLHAALEQVVHEGNYIVVDINGTKFTPDRPFTECVWCDGCKNTLGDERNALIIPELLEFVNKEA